MVWAATEAWTHLTPTLTAFWSWRQKPDCPSCETREAWLDNLEKIVAAPNSISCQLSWQNVSKEQTSMVWLARIPDHPRQTNILTTKFIWKTQSREGMSKKTGCNLRSHERYHLTWIIKLKAVIFWAPAMCQTHAKYPPHVISFNPHHLMKSSALGPSEQVKGFKFTSPKVTQLASGRAGVWTSPQLLTTLYFPSRSTELSLIDHCLLWPLNKERTILPPTKQCNNYPRWAKETQSPAVLCIHIHLSKCLLAGEERDWLWDGWKSPKRGTNEYSAQLWRAPAPEKARSFRAASLWFFIRAFCCFNLLQGSGKTSSLFERLEAETTTGVVV